MSIVAMFARQSATLERRTGADEWGNPAYSAPETIRARIDPARLRITDVLGDAVKPTLDVLTTESVAVGDRMTFDGVSREVLQVETIVWFDGKTAGYLARC